MKNILKHSALLLATLIFVTGCEKESISDVSNIAVASWHLSNSANNDSPIVVIKGTHLSLMDTSQGCLSHEWIVPTNSGIYFIDGSMNSSNPTAEDYESMIVDYSYINDNKTVHLLFKEAGEFTVKLRNTFNKPVTYTYKPSGETQLKSITTKYEHGVYVLEVPFIVKVYDNVMTPMAKIYYDADYTQEVVEDEIILEYGEMLYFVDQSTDAPTSWEWSVSDMTLENANTSELAIAFTQITAGCWVDLTVLREADAAKYIPAATAKSATLPLKITVIETSTPVEMGSITRVDARTISVSLANAAFDAASISTDDKDGFELKYTNSDAGVTTPTPIAVSDVKIDPNNPKSILLTLAEDTYNSDVMTLNYTGVDTIDILYNSNDFILSNKDVDSGGALYFSYDFESGTSDNKWIMKENLYASLDAISQDNATVQPEVVANPFKTGVNTSSYILSMDTSTIVGEPVLVLDIPFTGGTNTYNLKFKFNAGTVSKGLNPYFNVEGVTPTTETTWTAGVMPVWVSFWGISADTWYEYNNPIIGAIVCDKLRFILKLNAWRGVLRIDDISLGNLEQRPTI